MTPSTPFLHVHVSSSHLHLLLTSMHHTSRATHLHLNLASVAASSTHVDLTSMASSLDHMDLAASMTTHLDLSTHLDLDLATHITSHHHHFLTTVVAGSPTGWTGPDGWSWRRPGP